MKAACGAGSASPTCFTTAVTPTKSMPVTIIQTIPATGRSAAALMLPN